jgi:hypothetical protein
VTSISVIGCKNSELHHTQTWIAMRLTRIVLLILLITLALVTGTVFYNRGPATPSKLHELGFSLCDGRPCFMGVTLGMSWVNALDTVAQKKLPYIVVIENAYIYFRTQDYRFQANIDFDDTNNYAKLISVGDWSAVENQVSLADVIETFGPPCRVGVWDPANDSGRVVIDYPELEVQTDDVSPNSTIYYLAISTSDSDKTDCAGKTVYESSVNRWGGFQSLSYYRIDRLALK